MRVLIVRASVRSGWCSARATRYGARVPISRRVRRGAACLFCLHSLRCVGIVGRALFNVRVHVVAMFRFTSHV